MLLAKDVAGVEEDFVNVLDHSPGTKADKQFYLQSRGIRTPKTTYESMWQALVERLHRSGAGSTVFEYLRAHMPARLKELLQQSRRGRSPSLRASEPAIVWDLYFENGNLRRVGRLYLRYLDSEGGRLIVGTAAVSRKKSAKPYEIALSFAGEDRPFVAEVADRLRSMGISVFYDAFEDADLLGKDLAAHLGEVYRRRADYCAMFISTYYVQKAWPRLERQHAQARALAQQREYILPIRLDSTEVPGLSSTIGYIDARRTTPAAIASTLFRKIRGA